MTSRQERLPVRSAIVLLLLSLVLPGIAPAEEVPSPITSVTANAEEKSVTVQIPRMPDNQGWETNRAFRSEVRFIPPVQIRNVEVHADGVKYWGEFVPGKSYRVIMPESLVKSDSESDPSAEFRVPDLKPVISIADAGSVVERDSRQMIKVSVTNIPEVTVSSLRIPPALAFVAQAAFPSVSKSAAPPAPGSPRLARSRGARRVDTPLATPPAPAPNEPQAQFRVRDFGISVARFFARLDNASTVARQLAPFLTPPLERKRLFFPGAEKNRPIDFSLPLSFREGKERGSIELLSVRAERESGDGVVRLLRITDLSLTYKIGARSLLVWTTSLRTGRPTPNVDLLGITADWIAVPLGKTNADGILIVSPKTKGVLRDGIRLDLEKGPVAEPKPVPLANIAMIVAATGDDASFVGIDGKAAINPDWVPTASGNSTKTGMFPRKIHLFTERGAYRPGDPVHLRATAREYRNGAVVPPKGGLHLRVENPKQEVVFEADLSLSDFGTAYVRLETRPFWPRGTYTAHIGFGSPESSPQAPSPGTTEGDEDIADEDGPAPAASSGGTVTPPGAMNYTATTTFEVAEFRPPRHFASVSVRKETVKNTAFVNVEREETRLVWTISGAYYAGGPVRNGVLRWKLAYAPVRHPSPPGFADFTFGHVLPETLQQSEFIESGETTLDESGSATVVLPVSPEVASGLYAVELSAAVVDFDGRVASEKGVWREPKRLLVGLSGQEDPVAAGESRPLRIAVVDAGGKPVSSGTVVVELSRTSRVWVWKRNELGELFGNYEPVEARQGTSTLKLNNGRAILDLDFIEGGQYQVRVKYKSPDGTVASSSVIFMVEGGMSSYGDENRRRSFEKLAASADRKRYAPGDTAKIRIVPRRTIGATLVTIERGGILTARVLSGSSKESTIDVPIAKSYPPNVYVSLLSTVPRGTDAVFKGEPDKGSPSFLFGVVPLDVKAASLPVKVAIAPETPSLTGAPGSKKTIELTAIRSDGKGASVEMAVAVVDEAVLALTGYKTPSLDDLARFVSPLGVRTGDGRIELLGQVFFGFVRNEPLTGGDGDEEPEPPPVSVRTRKDFRPVAFFDPAVRTDGEGKASITVSLPDSTTTYRVFVVACDKKAGFASVQRNLLVTQEFYVEPGLPRFLTRGDRFRLLVAAANGTESAGRATVTASVDNLVTLSQSSVDADLKAHDRVNVQFGGSAVSSGKATFRFTGIFSGKSDAIEIPIPVNSGHLIQNEMVTGFFGGSTEIDFKLPPETSKIPWSSLAPGEASMILTISSSPFLRTVPGLRYLLHYPYGCVEQTSSGLMPLAGIRGLARRNLLPGISAEETDRFIEAGVARLRTMQVPGGGFAYWPGGREEDPWGTVYALSALLAVRESGHAVDNEVIRNAVTAVRANLADGVASDGRNGFALYLMARAGVLKNDPAMFSNYFDRVDSLPRETALMVLSAGKISGLVADADLRAAAMRVIDGSWSRADDIHYRAIYREPALALLCASLIFRDDPVAGRLAGELMSHVSRDGRWSSTSDTGWSLMALAEFFSRATTVGKTVEVKVDQEGVQPVRLAVPGDGIVEHSLDPEAFLKSPRIKLSGAGGETLTYLVSMKYPRVDVAKEGEENGFRLQKEIGTTNGKTEIRVGDVVKVTLTLSSHGRPRWSGLDHMVLDDPLPAGLEAINSAFRSEEAVAKTSGKESDRWSYWDEESRSYRFVPDRFEMRDDRVLAFRERIWMSDVDQYRFVYYARAALEGTFIVPSSKVQLMYEPEVAGFSPAGTLTILGR